MLPPRYRFYELGAQHLRPSPREAVSHILFSLRETWRAAPGVVALTFAGAAVSSQFGVAASYLQGLLVDRAIAVAERGAAVAILAAPLLFRLLVEVVQSGYSWVSNIEGAYLRTKVSNSLRISLLDRVSRLDTALIESPAGQDALEYAERNLSLVAYTPTMVAGLLRTSLTMVTSLAIIAAFDWRAAAVAGAVCVPCGVIFARMGRSRLHHELRATPENRRLYYASSLLRAPASVREARILGFRDYLLGRIRSLQDLLWHREAQLLATNHRRGFVAEFTVSVASVVGIAFVLAALVEGRITVGQLVFFMSLVVANIRRMESDTSAVTGAYESAARVGAFRRVMDMKPLIAWPEGAGGLTDDAPPGIEFREVSFTYPRTNVRALSGVSFTLRPGWRATLVGENGAGKTTLVKLLLRLYDPDEGQVLIDGRDIREYDLEKLWDKVAYLAQDSVRYELTARENIAFGRIGLIENDTALLAAAELGGIRRKIESLPSGLDTELGTSFGQAQQLSGGEWQRLALARAFARGATLAVLDEPTTSLDPLQESEILERAMDSIAGKTAIVVSHRLATARMADVILVMKDGRVVEEGPHAELLAAGGAYAELFEKQAQWYRDSEPK
ncbi:MAG: ABC transporter ATP-binding protein [Bacillota bacterium]|nr:ABC transporter ATP-binding protein [Bacillota bacterium]